MATFNAEQTTFFAEVTLMMVAQDHLQQQLNSFGARLREHRLESGWTLDDLAERSGLSKSFLSRLESGSRQASVAAVLTLSRIFKVSLASLFEEEETPEACFVVRGADLTPQVADGLTYTPLSHSQREFNLRPIRITVSLDRKGTEHYQHDGEEWIYVLSGKLTLSLDGRTYDLEAGDAAHFDSRLPHRLIARGRFDPEVILVASPSPAERGRPVRVATPVRDYRAIPALPCPVSI